MADPMTPERLAEIREREQAALSPTWTVVRDDHGSKGREIAIWAEEPGGYGYVTENLGTIRDADAEFIAHARQDVPALLAEVERLREQLAAFVPPGTLGAGETPALCGTCKDRLCVPGLPGCARCVADDMERLIAEVADERRRRAEYVRQIETERDAAREQVKRVRALSARLRAVDEIEEDALADRIDAALEDVVALPEPEADR